jgi:hypothetical protein
MLLFTQKARRDRCGGSEGQDGGLWGSLNMVSRALTSTKGLSAGALSLCLTAPFASLLFALSACNRAPDAGVPPGTSVVSASSTSPVTDLAPTTSASMAPAAAVTGAPFVATCGTAKFCAAMERGEAEIREKGKEPWAEIGTGTVQGGPITDVGHFVWGMQSGFSRCIKKAVKDDPESIKSGAMVRFVVRVDADGTVVGVSPRGRGVSGVLVTCLAARVSSTKFNPPTGGSATVEIPVTVHVP